MAEEAFRGPDAGRRNHHTASGDEIARPASRLEEDLLPNRAYPSNLLWRMSRALDPNVGPSRVLDLGPTSNANIGFWANAGFDVTCCDLYARESRRIGERAVSPLTLSSDALRQHSLPYEDCSFSAICSWNVLSRLPFVLAQRYAREAHRILAPAGLLHAVFLDADGRLDTRRHYEIVDHKQIRVSSAAIRRRLPDTWVDAEIRLMLSRFAACEIQPAPARTREVLAQRAPVTEPPR